MDNQNAKKGGLAGIAGDILRNEAKLTNEENVIRATDESGIDKHDLVVRPENYENVQTQSIVETAREQADKELAQIKAYNEEMLRRQKAEEAKAKAKRGIIRFLLVVFVIIIFGVLICVVINALMGVHTPPPPTPEPEPEEQGKYDTVNGYKCKTQKCYKMADMPDGRIVLRDDKYFIYDTTSKEAISTTIENQEYHNVYPFKWGDDILIDLDPESGLNGLFSVNSNRLVINFNYDAFLSDIKDTNYSDMNWAEGQYIIARKDSQYRLIRILDGKEIISGRDRVFVQDSFCIGFNGNGERRIYTLEGDQFTIIGSEFNIYIKGQYMVIAKINNTSSRFEMRGPDGKKITTQAKDPEYARLAKIKTKDFIKTMDADKSYYKVPAGD
jgi:hypothetical protein